MYGGRRARDGRLSRENRGCTRYAVCMYAKERRCCNKSFKWFAKNYERECYFNVGNVLFKTLAWLWKLVAR